MTMAEQLRQQGRLEGKLEIIQEIAQKLKQLGHPELVATITGLALSELG